MFKIFLTFLFSLFIKINSWTWDDYPSPQNNAYWKCGVLKKTYLCDPDGMLNDEERIEIVKLVENFKEKTKRPKSTFPCLREGIRLVVALSNNHVGTITQKSDYYGRTSTETIYNQETTGQTELCSSTINKKWIINSTNCIEGIELNSKGIYYCNENNNNEIPTIYKDDYLMIKNLEESKIKNKNYFEALKEYIKNLKNIYIHRLSIFDENNELNKEEKNLNNKNEINLNESIPDIFAYKILNTGENKNNYNDYFIGIILILLFCIGLIIILLVYKIEKLENMFKQQKTEVGLVKCEEGKKENNNEKIKNLTFSNKISIN